MISRQPSRIYRYLSAIRKLARGDQQARFELMKFVAGLFYPSYRFKWPQMGWWDDGDFTRYLGRFGELGGMNTDRRWMLGQLLRLTRDVPGDTAECGVYLGASSYLICRFNERLGGGLRQHLMFDSFEGLSAPAAVDGSYWGEGDLSAPLEAVKKALAEFPDTAYLKGWIPSRFAEVADRRFSFVHIDVDLHGPTRDSMEFFYSRMSPGGIILCDDYGCTTCPGATKAVDEFLRDKPEKMIALCSGGGFMIRGCPTAG
jgi:hypothetical protein